MAAEHATKICRKCNNELPLSCFHKQAKKTLDGLQRWCRDCSNEYRRKLYGSSESYRLMVNKKNRKLYYEDRDAYLLRNRKNEVRKKYGISWDQYQGLLTKQEHRCALCRADRPRGQGTWHIDHDHVTLVVRGLLCHRCNTMLGVLEKFVAERGMDAIHAYLKLDTGFVAAILKPRRKNKMHHARGDMPTGGMIDAVVTVRCKAPHKEGDIIES